jgi:hypothetical protein
MATSVRLRPIAWVGIAAALIVCVVVAAFVVLRRDDAPKASNDCDVVGQLVSQWKSTVGAAQTKLATSDNTHDDTLALADSEANAATKIRVAAKTISSSTIASELGQWAGGADQLAKSRRDEISHPNPDVTAPPPPDYVQGSEAVQEATAQLIQACPSAGSAAKNS